MNVWGGIDLIKDGGNLPEKDPVLWRERQRRQLGKARYQIRYMVVIVGITVMIALIDLNHSVLVSVFAWAIGSIVIVAQASNAVVSDRLAQSLEVMMTTPLTGAEIVRQKARALIPLVVVVAMPIWTLSFFGVFAGMVQGQWDRNVWTDAMFETVHLILFLNLFLVLGLAIGLGARSRVAAMMKVIGILVFWWALPALIIWFAESSRSMSSEEFMLYFGPSGVILGNRMDYRMHQDQLGTYLFALACYVFIGIALYAWCIRHADRKLGRPV